MISRSMPIHYEKYYKPILKFVRTRIAEHSVAEEVTQEVFLKAHRFRASYREEYAFSTWLWAIARNTVCDYLRAVRHSPNDGFAVTDETEFVFDELPSPHQNAETMLMKDEQRRSVLLLFARLSKLQKRV